MKLKRLQKVSYFLHIALKNFIDQFGNNGYNSCFNEVF